MARKPVSQATRRLFAATVELLDSLAPPDWQVEVARRSDNGGTIGVVSPDDVSGEFLGDQAVIRWRPNPPVQCR